MSSVVIQQDKAVQGEMDVKRLSLYKDFTKLSRCQIVSQRWLEERRGEERYAFRWRLEQNCQLVLPNLFPACSKTKAVVKHMTDPPQKSWQPGREFATCVSLMLEQAHMQTEASNVTVVPTANLLFWNEMKCNYFYKSLEPSHTGKVSD